MKKYPFLSAAFTLILLLGVLNFIADIFDLYWTLWWFDNVMHFLGGFSLAFFFLYIFYESDIFGHKISFTNGILMTFILVMIIAGAWEIFEYVNGVTQSTEKYSLDVMHDLLADGLGAVLASLFARMAYLW